MKKIILTAALLSIFSIASPAHASFQQFSGTLHGMVDGIGGEGYYFFSTSPANGCGGQRYFIPTSFPTYKDVVAQVMLAYTTGTTVTVITNGCSGTDGAAVSIGFP